MGTSACLCFCASYLTGQIAEIALSPEVDRPQKSLMQRFFQSNWFWAAPVLLFLIGGSLVLGSFLQLLKTGSTYEHWSRFIVMTFCFSTAIPLIVTRGIDYVLELVRERAMYWKRLQGLTGA